jgi:isocitrate lyase
MTAKGLFVQLGGLHSNAYISDLFAKAYATEGMKAYVELIQRKEAEIGCDVLTHQKVCVITRVLLVTF